ncbi:MAG TPA: CHASE3 domain-containing protein, partial [Polyangiaceae bacterium]
MGVTWTFGRKIGLGFALALAVMLVIGSVSYRSTGVLVDNNRAVTHSHQVLEGLSHVLSLMKDAETGQRGFVITGDEAYLEPYQRSLDPLKAQLAELRALTSDNPRQQQRLAELTPLVDEKLAELKRTIELRRTSGFEATEKVIAGNVGKQYMDSIRTVLGQMDQEERTLLKQRGDAADESAETTKTTITIGVILAVIFVSIAAWIITRSLTAQLKTAITSIRSSSAELEAAATQQSTGSREQSSAASEVS